jgi:hypothetical protein
MCRTITRCGECPLYGCGCGDSLKTSPEKILELVEQWSKEHPFKTNGEKFEEVFGDVMSGVIERISGENPAVSLQGLIVLKGWWDAEYKGM